MPRLSRKKFAWIESNELRARVMQNVVIARTRKPKASCSRGRVSGRDSTVAVIAATRIQTPPWTNTSYRDSTLISHGSRPGNQANAAVEREVTPDPLRHHHEPIAEAN